MDVRLVRAGDRQPDWLGPHCQQQAVVGNSGAAFEKNVARFGIDRDDSGFEPKIDSGVGVEAVGAQR